MSAQSIIRTYADIFGLDFEEVKEWVNAYIKRPGEFPALIAAGLIEPTEAERKASIQAYLAAEIDRSVTGRIRSEIAEEKAAIRQFEGGLTRMEADRLTDAEVPA
jgi:hypothetical protein